MMDAVTLIVLELAGVLAVLLVLRIVARRINARLAARHAAMMRDADARLRAALESLERARPPLKEFTLLGLPATATKDEVGKAYRKKVVDLHPDTGKEDATKFIEITQARDACLKHCKR